MAFKIPFDADAIAKGLSKITKDVSDAAQSAAKGASGLAQDAVSNLQSVDIAKAASDSVKNVTDFAQDTAGKVAGVAGKTASDIQTSVIAVFDENGDGQISIEDIIIMGLKVPGIRIDRTAFLKQELFKNHTQEEIDDAIAFNPAHAHIDREEIDKIADEVISYERNCVSGISAALGMPGGVAIAATIPTDIAQYYGYMLRAAQKLLYLYGFPEIDLSEKGQKFDSETINALTICLGVMFGVAKANSVIKAMAQMLAVGVEKKLLKAALTKGTIYPIVKSIASWFGKKMTKDVFAGFFKNSIPVIGGAIGGGLTFLSFKPCCDKLKASLQDTLLSNPDHQSSDEEMKIVEEIESTAIDMDEPENNTV